MKNHFIILLILVFCLVGNVAAQNRYYYELDDDSAVFPGSQPDQKQYFPEKSPQLKKEKRKGEIFDITPYAFSIRMGGGYAISFIDFHYEKNVYYNGGAAYISELSSDWGFTGPNLAFNIEMKAGLPGALTGISAGISIDYNLMPMNDVVFELSSSGGNISVTKDVANIHVVSFFGFLEYRRPIQLGKSWIAPYVQAGIGVNIHISDDSDIADVEQTSFALFIACGAEYFLNKNLSLFVEPRWHLDYTSMTYKPFAGGAFGTDLDLSNLSMLIGINLYWGMGKTL